MTESSKASKQNHDHEVRARDRDPNLVAQKLVRLYVLHDLLPCEDEAPGLAVGEIVELMTEIGFECQNDTVRRDLKELAEFAYLETNRCNRAVLWKRLYETRLTDALVDPPPVPDACCEPAANDPEFFAA